MRIPTIRIEQQNAIIGMKNRLAKITIEQPKADFSVKQNHVKVELETTKPQLEIDSTKAWSALGSRPSLELAKVIHDKARSVASEAVAKIVEQGNRLAAIHLKEDPIPEFAKDTSIKMTELYYEGEPNYDNVDVQFTPGTLKMNWNPGKVEIESRINNPRFDYFPGKLEIYLQQKNNIKIIPPQIDINT